MPTNKVLITGSCGLVGSEAVHYFLNLNFEVIGIDNNNRGSWFNGASTTKVLSSLTQNKGYSHNDFDITEYKRVQKLIKTEKPALIIHCAAQPSHDLSAEIPLDDFSTNAFGTMSVLDPVRRYCPDSPFVYVSTNKVYGDRPNQISMKESDLRFDYNDPEFENGISERMSIDQCLHSPFGGSKLSADIMVQEYGRYYDIPTACFRCGCITGIRQQGVKLHGFLNHLCKTAKSGNLFTIYGHDGKQVRDNIHSKDLVSAFHEFYKSPKNGAVYNIGGGKENSCSILEAMNIIKEISGIDMQSNHGPSRKGDHICYYTDNSKFKSDYPEWEKKMSLQDIFKEMLL
jgi:CDP-paratose 2-epimerase